MDKFTRWLRLCLLIVSAATFSHAVEIPPGTIRDFKPGLATKQDPADICDSCAQDLSNVDVNTGAIEKRRGSVKVNSTVLGGFTNQPTRFLHEFVDASNNSWLLSISSNTLFKSNDGGATNNVATSTHGITSLSRFCGVNAFGYARLTDGTTNWILFDGSSVTSSTSSPHGATCEFFGERVITSVGSVFYASRFGDAEDWIADAGTDNDAFSTQVRQNDGYKIRSIKRFKYGLLVLKDYSTDLFTLSSDGLTFIQTSISNTVGTQYPESVMERENDVIWLGHDGYYLFNGSQLLKISEIIKPTIDQIKQLDSAQRTYTETSQSDFGSGSNNQTSITLLSGSVKLSTATDIDTLSVDFSGTTSSTSIINDRIYLSTNNTNATNNSFENGTTTDADNWIESGNTVRCGSSGGGLCHICSPDSGLWEEQIIVDGTSPYTLTFTLLDKDGNSLTSNQIANISIPSSCSSYSNYSFNLLAYAGRYVKIRITAEGGNYLESDVFLCGGGTLNIPYATVGTLPSSFRIDNITGGVSSIYSGTYTSSSFDSLFTSSAWITSSANSTANGHSITWQTQSSSNGSNWQTAASWTPGTPPTSDNRRYLRYIVTLSTGGTTNGTALPYVDDVTLSGRAIDGRYTSTAINTSAGSSWAPFTGTLDTSSGGTATFEIYTDTDTVIVATNPVTFVSSQTVTSGGTPTIAINTYAHVSSSFSITTGTQDPLMSDFTLSWNEGSSIFPVSSLYHQGNYISSVALNRTDRNDSMLVYDINGAWTIYTYPAYYLTKYRQKPFFGSGIQGDIVRFQEDDIYQDFDASAISAYWISKDFDFGYPLTNKTINRYYVTAKYRANDVALFEWGTNRGTLTSEGSIGMLDLDSVTGFFRKSIVPSSLTYKKGLSHRFKFSNSTLGDRFDILSVTIKADLETSP